MEKQCFHCFYVIRALAPATTFKGRTGCRQRFYWNRVLLELHLNIRVFRSISKLFRPFGLISRDTHPEKVRGIDHGASQNHIHF